MKPETYTVMIHKTYNHDGELISDYEFHYGLRKRKYRDRIMLSDGKFKMYLDKSGVTIIE